MARYDANRCRHKRRYLNFDALGWAESVQELPRGPNNLLLFLARRSDKFGCCFFKQDQLAIETRYSSRSVRSFLHTLEELDLVRRIGRCSHGQQISSVYHLIGWPDRKNLPSHGHPTLGKYVKESALTPLEFAVKRQILPPEPEKNADHNNIVNTTTTVAEKKLLETCFQALGGWATNRNRELLTDDVATLLDLIEQGFSLEKQILSVLRNKSMAKQKIPVIRTWRYFAEAIAEKEDREAATEHQTYQPAKTLQSKPTNRSGERGASFNQEMDRFLRNAAKTGRTNIDPDICE